MIKADPRTGFTEYSQVIDVLEAQTKKTHNEEGSHRILVDSSVTV